MVTRRVLLLVAVMAALVGGVAGAVASAQVVQSFSDVPMAHPFHTEIEWGAANGIVDGYADGTFRPTNPVSRQAAIAFLSRYNDELELLHASAALSPAATGGTVVAVCPAGKRALAGGGYTPMNALGITSSAPQTSAGGVAIDPTQAVRWRVRFDTTHGDTIGSPVTASAWVLCAPQPAG